MDRFSLETFSTAAKQILMPMSINLLLNLGLIGPLSEGMS